VVILDEPMKGLDPESRKHVCDFLKKHSRNRTILLSTQYMEAADMLADRVAILVNGQVKCCGSPQFLKKAIGKNIIYSKTLHS